MSEDYFEMPALVWRRGGGENLVKVAGREYADGEVVWEGLAYEVDEALGYRQPVYADICGWDGNMRAVVDSKYAGGVRVQRWVEFDGQWVTMEFGRSLKTMHPPSADEIVRLVVAGRLAAVRRKRPTWRLRLNLSRFTVRLLRRKSKQNLREDAET
jgi:hypothetical protein